MGKLSTHILDLAHGKPAGGMQIELYRIDAGNGEPASRHLLKHETSNADGRTASPLLEGDTLLPGCYELVFAAGDYFAAIGVELPTPRFVDRVTLAFGVADASQNYHVPLLVSPWAYSTYRGS
jgi:5-hydroxyisourate hydrolase